MRRFGSEVTLVERNGHLAHREDEDITQALGELCRDEGICGVEQTGGLACPHRLLRPGDRLALARVAEEFDGWAPELRALITDSETDPISRAIHALPIEHRWDRVPGVTLLGDAAHLMSPFAGEGANPADVEAALIAYEKDLFPRSASAAEEVNLNSKLFFNDNSPQSVVDLFANYKSVK